MTAERPSQTRPTTVACHAEGPAPNPERERLHPAQEREFLAAAPHAAAPECPELAREHEQLLREHEQLSHALGGGNTERRERRAIQTASASQFGCSGESEERPLEREASLAKRVLELESERDELDRSLKALKMRVAAREEARQHVYHRVQRHWLLHTRKLSRLLMTGEAMAREVQVHFQSLRRREQLARQEAKRWQDEETATRRQLSYRLGSAIVSQSRHASDWWKIPGSMLRALSEFRKDRQARGRRSSSPVTEEMAVVADSVAIALGPEWQSVRVKGSLSERELWAKVLSASARGSIGVEMRILGSAALEVTARSPLADCPLAASIGAGVVSLPALLPDSLVGLLRVRPKSGDFELALRMTQDTPCVLRLELRRGSADVAGESVHESGASGRCPADATASAAFERSEGSEGAASPSGMEGDSDAAGVVVAASPVGCGANQHDQSATPEGVSAVVAPTRDVPGTIEHRAAPPTRSRRPATEGIIWQANALIAQGRIEEGFRLAEQRANELERHAIHILRANERIADDAEWLACLNEYVGQFGIRPIRLNSTDEARYLRLSADTPSSVELGPVVSVIMPAFNSERTLRFAAQSILRQSWRPLELIIVDDASTDATLSIAQDIAGLDSRVRLLRNSANLGPYVSKNFGLRIARGAYVTGHDADDWAHPERIQRQVEAMLREGGPRQASLTKMLRLTFSGKFCSIGRTTPSIDDGVLQTAFVSCMVEMGFFRARLGYWDSVRFGADSELIARTRQILGSCLVTLRELGMLCLDSDASLTNDPLHGVFRNGGMSPTRAEYCDRFMAWHRALDGRLPPLPLPHEPRLFPAPAATLVDPQVVRSVLAQHCDDSGSTRGTPHNAGLDPYSELEVDVCIMTNLSLSGEDASSTLEDVQVLNAAGLAVRLVHCAHDLASTTGRSSRFDPIAHLCIDEWKEEYRITCRLLIVRPAAAIMSRTFLSIATWIQASSMVFVVDSSMFHANGAAPYSLDELNFLIDSLPCSDKYVCPSCQGIRDELTRDEFGRYLPIADFDWSSTRSIEMFLLSRLSRNPI